jgi:membrane protease subunit (stomatin/prohibitin family)
MSWMDKLRAELIDIVEWIDDSEHTLVWRFPRFHNQIKYGAQLIVRPGQEAIFVSQGRVADVFGPGQYRLETKNLPILSTVLGWKYGFDSPFKAEVYFVSTRQITDLKWGTPNPVIMRDADFGPVRVRAFGTYTLRAVEPRTLLTELVGTDHDFEADEVTELLRSAINMSFADVVSNAGVAVMDLATRYKDLAEDLRRAVVERIDDEFGLEVPQLYIVNISLPAEVEKALDARSGMGIIGDMQRFQAYQLGQAIPDAATNPAGGLAGAGVGLGMGMAMAGPMMGALGSQGAQAAPAAAPASAAPPPPPAVAWHVAENGQSVGPMSVEQLAQMVAQGRLTGTTLVWSAGMAGWLPASQVPALAGLLQSAPPPVPGR